MRERLGKKKRKPGFWGVCVCVCVWEREREREREENEIAKRESGEEWMNEWDGEKREKQAIWRVGKRERE